MAILYFLVGIIMFGYGVLCLFYPEKYWQMYRSGSGIKAEAFEVTSMIDCQRIMVGLMGLGLGIIAFGAGLVTLG